MQISECPFNNEYDEGNLFQFLAYLNVLVYTVHMSNKRKNNNVCVFVCISFEIFYEALQTFLWFVHLILNDVYLREKKE